MIEVTTLNEIQTHPDASALEIGIVEGWSCCIRKEEFFVGDKIVFIPPDSLVPVERPEFAFLKDGEKEFVRIRAKKIRGVPSYGLIIKAPERFEIGDDVTSYFNIGHYNPPEPRDGEIEKVNHVLDYITKYDVESFQQLAKRFFIEGEEVVLTEKLHGENQRFVFLDNQMWVGSRNMWKREGDNYWWNVLKKFPQIEEYCRTNPGNIVYGENYGSQSLKYGLQNGHRGFAAFDIRNSDNRWLDYDEARAALDCPWVPFVARIPYNFETCMAHAEGQSLIPGATNRREGVVLSPIKERYDARYGRVKLKIVSATFLEKDK